MRISISLICLVLLFFACEEPFFPELDRYDNLLVVDGRITDEPGPYTIRLNQSSELYIEESPPLTGAEVILSDDAGNSEVLQEKTPGEYVTDIMGIQGTVGRKYHLEINTSDGRQYVSSEEMLHAAVAIDTVTAAVEYRQDVNFDYDLSGYQFYLEGALAAQKENYYLWELEGTYEYNTDYLIDFIFLSSGFEPYPDPDEFHTCWLTYPIPNIFTFSTQNLDRPEIKAFPLNFLDTETRQLAIRFSLLTRQYSLSPEAYEFWHALEEQIGEQGALYSRQPYQIRGNIQNVADEEEPVLGYFLAAGVSEKRIFVNRPEGVPFHYGKCKLTTEMLALVIQEGDFVGVDEDGAYGIGKWFCLDCRDVGGGIEKPDFWID